MRGSFHSSRCINVITDTYLERRIKRLDLSLARLDELVFGVKAEIRNLYRIPA